MVHKKAGYQYFKSKFYFFHKRNAWQIIFQNINLNNGIFAKLPANFENVVPKKLDSPFKAVHLKWEHFNKKDTFLKHLKRQEEEWNHQCNF